MVRKPACASILDREGIRGKFVGDVVLTCCELLEMTDRFSTCRRILVPACLTIWAHMHGMAGEVQGSNVD